MPNPLYALILAGGSGERFWPLSRRTRPKQLLRLVSQQPLLEQALKRLEGLVAPERLLILTNVDQEAAVRELLPQVPNENIVAEPAKRDTAAAVALGVGWIAARDHSATMIVLPADHVINDTAAFQKTLTAAATAAEEAGARSRSISRTTRKEMRRIARSPRSIRRTTSFSIRTTRALRCLACTT